MEQQMLQDCVKISIESPNELSADLISEVIDTFLKTTQRRILWHVDPLPSNSCESR
jgi:hypothetical protein